MSPSDFDDIERDPRVPRDSGAPSDPRVPRRTDRYAGRRGEPTAQYRIDRRAERARPEQGGAPPSRSEERPVSAGSGRSKERVSRIVAVAVLLAVAVVFVIAGVVAASASSDETEGKVTVPISVLPITPEYLREGGSTSTTAYPESPPDGSGDASSDGSSADSSTGSGTATATDEATGSTTTTDGD